MSSVLMRAMLDDINARGPIWEPETLGDMDLLFDGIADNLAQIWLFVSSLADIRNPLKTIMLDDLEREYGIATNLLIPEATRRMRLAGIVYARSDNGTEDDMQAALRNVGFDVYVYQNSPAVDPDPFLSKAFQMVAGGDNAYAGRADAYAGSTGGELLVNGDIFNTSRVYTSGAGSGLYAGTGHGAGEYEDLLIEKIEYPIPTAPNDWPLVFFVGGAVTRDGTGAILTIDNAIVDGARENEFKSTILRYKPLDTWAALIVTYS